jgi:type I restriction enzyme S subunit
MKSDVILKTEDYITDAAINSSSTNLIDHHSILIVTRSGILRNMVPVALNKKAMAINQDLKAFINSDTDIVNYVFHFLKFHNRQLLFSTSKVGTTVESLDFNALKSFEILLPGASERVKIADVLFTWDDAIAKTQQLITQLQQRNKGLMQQLLSGKKRLKGFETTKWHLKSLEEVGIFRNGKAHENLIDGNGKYVVVNSKFISTEGKTFKKSSASLSSLLAGDIVMVMSDIPNGKALAKCFFIDENNKYTLNQRICSITSKENTNSKFLFYLLNRNYHYLSFDNGVSQTNLKKEEVLECPLLMPEKDEQEKIAQILDASKSEVQLFERKLAALQQQKKGLMQKLLTGEVRVKIDKHYN